MNYNSTEVGVPYIRCSRIEIFYPEDSRYPQAILSQKLAVKLKDGTIKQLEDLPPINITFDMPMNGNSPIPLVDPTNGSALGPTTTLNQVMLSILAVVRQEQLKQV
jgi:hypothetical protein